MAWIAAAAAVGSAILGKNASDDAAGTMAGSAGAAGDAQLTGMREALAAQMGMFDFQLGATAPQRSMGTASLGAMSQFLGLNMPQADAHDYDKDIVSINQQLDKISAKRKRYMQSGKKLSSSDRALMQSLQSQADSLRKKLSGAKRSREEQTLQRNALAQFQTSPAQGFMQEAATKPVAQQSAAPAGGSIMTAGGGLVSPAKGATAPPIMTPAIAALDKQIATLKGTNQNKMSEAESRALGDQTKQLQAQKATLVAQAASAAAPTPGSGLTQPPPALPQYTASGATPSAAPPAATPAGPVSTWQGGSGITPTQRFDFNFDESKVGQTDAYKFRQEQSLEALDRRLAAGGMRGSGNRYAGILEMASGLASQEYEAEYGRQYGAARDAYSSQFDMYNLFAGMSGMAGVGVQDSVGAGANMAGILQQGYGGMADARMMGGQAGASGIMGQNNAMQNMMSQLFQIGGDAGWFDKD